MPRQTSAQRAEEIDRLAKYLQTFFEYMRTHGMGTESANRVLTNVKNARDRGDLRALRVTRADTNNWLREMPPANRAEIQALLLKEAGYDVTAEQDRKLRQIRSLEAKGRIATEEEYRLVQDWIDEIYEDPANDREVEMLEQLLNTFTPQQPRNRGKRRGDSGTS